MAVYNSPLKLYTLFQHFLFWGRRGHFADRWEKAGLCIYKSSQVYWEPIILCELHLISCRQHVCVVRDWYSAILCIYKSIWMHCGAVQYFIPGNPPLTPAPNQPNPFPPSTHSTMHIVQTVHTAHTMPPPPCYSLTLLSCSSYIALHKL